MQPNSQIVMFSCKNEKRVRPLSAASAAVGIRHLCRDLHRCYEVRRFFGKSVADFDYSLRSSLSLCACTCACVCVRARAYACAWRVCVSLCVNVMLHGS